MLGGDIVVVSEPGQGSRFHLNLPGGPLESTMCVSPDQFELDQGPRRKARRSQKSLHGRIVQLVEDSMAIAALVRHLLVEAGAEVRHAEDGEQGIKAVLESITSGSAPDLILMDMQMPVLDGYSAAAELRRQGVEIPIVALTAFALADDQQKCLAAGCSSYLSKPIDPGRLVSQVEDCLNQ